MTDVTDDTFETAVLDRSEVLPVVVDLWAPWCGPCRALGPLIEESIDATGGAVELVKVNVDENPRTSKVFAVQSIPAVYAVRNRKVVDGFIGALGRKDIDEFVARLLPSPAEAEVDRLVAIGDESSLRSALELAPGAEKAVLALAELLVASGQSDEALELLARIPETADVRRLVAAARTGDARDADIDHELDDLIGRVKSDEDARRRYLDLLELLGPEDPRTAHYRKLLAAALY